MNPEQRMVYDLILKEKQNVFFTGPAGTGKSWLLERIIEGLKGKYTDDGSRQVKFAVTASTGSAATNIDGISLHRFAGIFLGNAPTEILVKDINKDSVRRSRWRTVEVLIIDEVSMIDATLFDKLDEIARTVREIDKPFGGLQLILSGDFFQLPPVLKGPDDGRPRFCFEAEAWKRTMQHTIGLTCIYRQTDPIFRAMLNEVREGRPSLDTINKFRRLDRSLRSKNGLKPTVLYPIRRQVERANLRQLRRLPGPEKTYIADDSGAVEDETIRKRLLRGCIAPERLQLKLGAQVMLIRNLNDVLVNGSQGQVVGFENKKPGQYDWWWEDGLLSSDDTLERTTSFPKVRFSLKNDMFETLVCSPERWVDERWLRLPNPLGGWMLQILAARVQVPLVLAWALSIHKAQGQTLGLVKVDLGSVFEMGQAYVALSRAVSMKGLQVKNFDPDKVVAHPRVKEFYAGLSKVPVINS